MYCSNCNSKNEDSASFCMRCGQALIGGAAEDVWSCAGSIPGAVQRTRPQRPVQPVYAPPMSVRPPAAAGRAGGAASNRWLIPVIILAALAIVAAVLFSTAKRCANCEHLFWGESHNFLGYTVCDDCWY